MAHMSIRSGFSGTVGDTPLIRLQSLSAETGCNILGKAEFLNPGGSVKDRAALYIIRDAEQRGALKPGGTRSSKAPPVIPESDSHISVPSAGIAASS